MRERHGPALKDLYRDMYLRPGLGGRWRYRFHLLWDAVPAGFAARWEERRRTRLAAGRTRVGWLETVQTDLRITMRTLKRSPGFALMTIGVLVLGIGGNVAVFSVVTAATGCGTTSTGPSRCRPGRRCRNTNCVTPAQVGVRTPASRS
jgi:hypothetical protein